MFLLTSWPVRAALAAVVLVAAAAAGWWFFVRSDAELADSPLAIRDSGEPTATVAAGETPPAAPGTDNSAQSAPEPSPGFERWVIVAEHPDVEGATEAAYFADEKLASLSLPSTAKGTTFGVEGSFVVGADGLDPAGGSEFTVDVAGLRSGESRRDSRVQGALKTSQFPQATFIATSLTGLPAQFPDGEEVPLTLTGLLTIAGVEREVTWNVIATQSGDVMTALATVNFLYADFEIPQLDFAGFVEVEDDVTLQVQIIAVRDA